jgi:hypothetical protein
MLRVLLDECVDEQLRHHLQDTSARPLGTPGLRDLRTGTF